MPALNIMIKPASGLCNLRCRYCFYRDVARNRDVDSYGIMTPETLEAVIREIFAYANTECTIAWQGGEPTLAGLDFFRHYIALEEKYNVRKIPVHRVIQTNGYVLDEEWAVFLAEHKFLTGLSLDGVRNSHDRNRVTPEGEGSFSKVFAAAKLLERHGVDFNILTVVNPETVSRIRQIYAFYGRQGFSYQQYIACLDPLGEVPGGQSWSLTPELYGKFLIDLFELWYQDCLRGRAPYIRQFDNYIAILRGYQPESCEQRGVCGLQTVVEADGSVYPCDFYVMDDYRLGNLRQDSLAELAVHPLRRQFFERSVPLAEGCDRCPYRLLCRGGCFRHRLTEEGGTNRFCAAYRMFFDRCLPRLQQLARAGR